MKWNKVDAGKVHRAFERFMQALGNHADEVIEGLSTRDDYVTLLAQEAVWEISCPKEDDDCWIRAVDLIHGQRVKILSYFRERSMVFVIHVLPCFKSDRGSAGFLRGFSSTLPEARKLLQEYANQAGMNVVPASSNGWKFEKRK